MKYVLENKFIPYSRDMIRNFVVYHYILALLLFINLHIYNVRVHAINIAEEIAKVPAIIVFGDSIVDPGNNNYLATIGKANFPPYGRDFPGGIPTGRYSNGKVPSDLLAELLGIKEFVPPYLDPNLQMSDYLTGVSFASGAAGYDPNSSKLANALSLEDQLKLFREYINKLKAEVGENTTSNIISKSVYLVCAGSNDITNTYFTLPSTRLQYNISTYTSLMTHWASSFVQELYALGGRRIGLISAPPCGCLPSQRLLHNGLLRACADDENQASIMFNDKLISELSSLNQKLPDSRVLYLDIYNPLLNLINNPSHSGFEVSIQGCCGTGNMEVSFLCNKYDVGTCKDASKYVFWDSFHPTEAAYKNILNEVYQKSFGKFF